MSFLNAKANLTHRTALPDSVTFEDAVALLRDHPALFRLDPEFRSCTADPPPASPIPNTKYYTVTDHMEVPLGLWDSTVSFTAEITDVPTGIEWLIRGPLGLVQTTSWLIQASSTSEDEDKKCLYLVEEVEIRCSRLLVGVVRTKCEDNWRGIHGGFVELLTKS